MQWLLLFGAKQSEVRSTTIQPPLPRQKDAKNIYQRFAAKFIYPLCKHLHPQPFQPYHSPRRHRTTACRCPDLSATPSHTWLPRRWRADKSPTHPTCPERCCNAEEKGSGAKVAAVINKNKRTEKTHIWSFVLVPYIWIGYEMSGERRVVYLWVLWDECCEMNGARWVVWDEWCEMSGVRWVVWEEWLRDEWLCDECCDEWCEMNGMRWLVKDDWWEMSGVRWMLWDEWCEMSGVRWLARDELCELCEMCAVRWVVWDERCEMTGERWVVWDEQINGKIMKLKISRKKWCIKSTQKHKRKTSWFYWFCLFFSFGGRRNVFHQTKPPTISAENCPRVPSRWDQRGRSLRSHWPRTSYVDPQTYPVFGMKKEPVEPPPFW